MTRQLDQISLNINFNVFIQFIKTKNLKHQLFLVFFK